MSTELGKAFVQIMPSAKGISGSIQQIINPEAKKAGKSAGINIANSMADSMGKAGKSLTKAITVPVAGAATAAAGLVGALGWGRLTGLDSAQAKLQGLGYDIEAVERISELVEDSIQGTVTTMAEGVSVAAGGLAAGVKEGEELERYIKLVGDAAVGAERDVGSMAQIFNRVQGSGRLMTQELNMIDDAMPGFAMSMAEHLGVPIQEFRKMVTEGEVTSQDFLTVMDDFAGDMSDAYAGTWQGMVKNTISNIGILGENILSGVFEQSKDSIAEFLEFLRSDTLKDWAVETGKRVSEAFSNMIETVKGVISWWTNLDDETKMMIAKIAGIAVALGPVLMGMSKLIKVGLLLVKGFGLIKAIAGVVATAISAISWPVVLVVGAIAGLIAIFTKLYKENERFREIVGLVWEEIKNVIMIVAQTVSDFVMGIVGGLVDWWQENQELIMETAKVVWETIQNVIVAVLDFLLPVIKTAWEGIKNNIAAAWDLITTIVETGINFVKGIIKAVMQMITGDWSGAWETIKNTASNLLDGIKSIISKQLNLVFTIISGLLNNVIAKFRAIFGAVWSVVGDTFNKVVNSIRNGMSKAYNTVKGYFTRFKNAGRNIVNSIADGIKGAIGKVTDAISNVTGKIRDFLPFSPANAGPMMDRNETSKQKANKTVQTLKDMTNLSNLKLEGLTI